MRRLDLDYATLLFDGLVLEIFTAAGSHRFLVSRLAVRAHEDRKSNLVMMFGPVVGILGCEVSVPPPHRQAFDDFMAAVLGEDHTSTR